MLMVWCWFWSAQCPLVRFQAVGCELASTNLWQSTIPRCTWTESKPIAFITRSIARHILAWLHALQIHGSWPVVSCKRVGRNGIHDSYSTLCNVDIGITPGIQKTRGNANKINTNLKRKPLIHFNMLIEVVLILFAILSRCFSPWTYGEDLGLLLRILQSKPCWCFLSV